VQVAAGTHMRACNLGQLIQGHSKIRRANNKSFFETRLKMQIIRTLLMLEKKPQSSP
jgi:hypothetical protein